MALSYHQKLDDRINRKLPSNLDNCEIGVASHGDGPKWVAKSVATSTFFWLSTVRKCFFQEAMPSQNEEFVKIQNKLISDFKIPSKKQKQKIFRQTFKNYLDSREENQRLTGTDLKVMMRNFYLNPEVRYRSAERKLMKRFDVPKAHQDLFHNIVTNYQKRSGIAPSTFKQEDVRKIQKEFKLAQQKPPRRSNPSRKGSLTPVGRETGFSSTKRRTTPERKKLKLSGDSPFSTSNTSLTSAKVASKSEFIEKFMVDFEMTLEERSLFTTLVEEYEKENNKKQNLFVQQDWKKILGHFEEKKTMVEDKMNDTKSSIFSETGTTPAAVATSTIIENANISSSKISEKSRATKPTTDFELIFNKMNVEDYDPKANGDNAESKIDFFLGKLGLVKSTNAAGIIRNNFPTILKQKLQKKGLTLETATLRHIDDAMKEFGTSKQSSKLGTKIFKRISEHLTHLL